jgi:mRNA interferase MazF
MNPSRGEVWLVELDPTRGHEQGGTGPALVVSVDRFNRSAAGLVVILPITTKDKGIPSHVRVEPQKHGLIKPSFIKCEEVRCISKDRLVRLYGTIDSKSMTEVEYRLRIILDL